MVAGTVEGPTESSRKKIRLLRQSPSRYFLLSMLAGSELFTIPHDPRTIPPVGGGQYP
jgi:hypothetical protein